MNEFFRRLAVLNLFFYAFFDIFLQLLPDFYVFRELFLFHRTGALTKVSPLLSLLCGAFRGKFA